MSGRSTHAEGEEGEKIALEFLEGQGFRVLETNYRYERGELDIVAQEGEVLVFCEVKYRQNEEFGPPEYAVTPRKQAQVRKVALGYLAERNVRDTVCRFDVIAIQRRGGHLEVRHLRNAF